MKLFIQRAKADMPFAKFVAEEQNRRGKPLSIYTLMILSVLNNERRSTVDRIVELTNLSGNKVRSAIEAMIELGLIEASGKGNNRTYILGEKFIGKTRKAFNMFVRRTLTVSDIRN